ncbi:MAG: XRE family transcriptional regulator [Peptococcaceae bacterium BRH_c8a]|nr:MAG: XRE family transcriptional regulator [Peptococcaceae bacterium BRH_c8a]
MVKIINGGVESNGYLQYNPDYVVPPGETLLETIEHLSLTQAELAERTGRPKKTINEIIKGKASITPETALQLERVLGVPASFWNNLELNYREKLAEIEEKKRMQTELDWLKEIPVNEMIKQDWISGSSIKTEQLKEALRFFGVATVEAWRELWKRIIEGHNTFGHIVFRQSPTYKSEPGALAAWIRKGQIDSHNIKCKPFKASEFRKALENIKNLTKEPPDVFVNEMTSICSNAGVAVVFVPEMPKSRVNGATYWLNSQKAVIQLSLRYKTDDHLWFTFFHEARHVLQNKKRDVFLEYNGLESELEEDANGYASDFLIPKVEYKKFIDQGNISYSSVQSFAERLNIAPGIVVGRLQHDKVIPYSHLNNLKRYFKWANDGGV